MTDKTELSGEILDEQVLFTLEELCVRCSLPKDEIILLVQEGVIEPAENKQGEDSKEWQFHWRSLTRIRTTQRLREDLGINLAGAALAIELLERIDQLEQQLKGLGLSES